MPFFTANKQEEYGPDNPRPWDPNHPTLKSPTAPHETRAVMRMHRTGKPGPTIMDTLKITAQALMSQLQKAMDEEGGAHRKRVPIHDARVPKGTK